MLSTISELSKFSVPGMIVVGMIAIVLIVIVLSVLKYLSDKDLKFKNLEVTTNTKLDKLNDEIVKTKDNVGSLKENTELLTREALRKQLDYANDAVMSHEDLIYEMIINYYRLTPNRHSNLMSTIRLFVRHLLSNISTKLTSYLTDNHIGNTKYEITNYCRLRSLQISHYIKEFISRNSELIPRSINLSSVFRFNDSHSLNKYIYTELLSILINCKLFGGTVLDPSNVSLSKELLTVEEYDQLKFDES